MFNDDIVYFMMFNYYASMHIVILRRAERSQSIILYYLYLRFIYKTQFAQNKSKITKKNIMENFIWSNSTALTVTTKFPRVPCYEALEIFEKTILTRVHVLFL